MPCVREFDIPVRYIENSHPCGYKHSRFIRFAKLCVCRGKNLVNRLARFGIAFDYGFCRHHEHCGGYSLAGHVGDQESEPVFAHKIEVVKIAADLLCGIHSGVYVKFAMTGIRRKDRRYRGMLNCFCKFKLLVDTCRRLRDISLQRHDGRIDIVRKRSKFLVCSDIDNRIKISARYFRKRFVYFYHVVHDKLFYQEIDNDKQHAEHNEFHEYRDINGGIAREHRFRLRNCRDNIIALGNDI